MHKLDWMSKLFATVIAEIVEELVRNLVSLHEYLPFFAQKFFLYRLPLLCSDGTLPVFGYSIQQIRRLSQLPHLELVPCTWLT